jgi:hypothetical protein
MSEPTQRPDKKATAERLRVEIVLGHYEGSRDKAARAIGVEKRFFIPGPYGPG